MANVNEQATKDASRIRGRRKRSAVASLAVILLVMFLLAILRWDELLLMWPLLGLAVLLYAWVFPITAVVLSGACICQYRQMQPKWVFIVLPVAAVAGSGVTILVWFLLVSIFSRVSLLTGAAAISCCLTYCVCRRYRLPSALWALPVMLAVVVLLAVPTFLRESLSYVYGPSVITRENLPVYKACIRFARDNEKYGDIVSKRGGRESAEHEVGYEPIADFLSGVDRLRGLIAEDEYCRMAGEAKRLRGKLEGILCYTMKRDNNIILFFRNGNHILPVGSGIAYSLSGANPNELSSKTLDKAKPFVNITGDWYFSRRLVVSGPRRDVVSGTPEPLIDRASFLEGIEPNELCTFD